MRGGGGSSDHPGGIVPRTSGLRRAVAPGLVERGEGPATPGGPVIPPADHLDRLIHERLRLGIISALTASPVLTFTELKKLLKTTDGNLSVHARKLEEAGYIACLKTFEGRTPRTEFRLTPAGKAALLRYLEHMEALIEATRKLTQ
jgi:DNA-binding HxlR family transcriptional regulator